MRLDNVTLVTIETHYHDLASRALEECVRRVPFKKVMTFSDRDIFPGAKNVPVKIADIRDYCDFMLKCMWPFVETDYIVFAQWDAMIFDETKWTDDFLNYDYIGAVWPWEPAGQNVGCGGFSLRSRRLLHALRNPVINMRPNSRFGLKHEDAYIGVEYRRLLEQTHAMKFAPTELAQQFSYELGDYSDSMSFHGFWNIIRFMPNDTIDYFFTRRPGNIFQELHRAHHTIIELARRGRMDLLDMAVDDIKKNDEYDKLRAWLANEDFPYKEHVMSRLD
jgi:hypothetical protein